MNKTDTSHPDTFAPPGGGTQHVDGRAGKQGHFSTFHDNAPEYRALSQHLDNMVDEYSRELREKNMFTQVLLDASPDNIVVFDKDARYLLVNNKALETHMQVFGRNVTGLKYTDVVPEMNGTPVYKALLAALAGKPGRVTELYSARNETYYDTDFIPVHGDKGVYAVMAIARDVTERVRAKLAGEAANKLLQQQNGFIQTILNATQEWIVAYDKDMRLIMANDACVSALRSNREDMIGKTFYELYPAGAGTKAETDLLRALSGETVSNDAYQSAVTGRWIKNYLTPLRDDEGNIIAALAVAQDMTEMMRSQEELKRTQQHFSVLFNVSPVAISLSRCADGVIIDVNKAWEKLFRTTRLHVLGHAGIGGLKCPNSHQPRTAADEYMVWEEEFDYSDGGRAYLYVSVATIELEGVQCYLSAYIDITERKTTEERIVRLARELADRNQELKEAQRLSHTGSWEWDMVSDAITWSDELYNIFGVVRDSTKPTYQQFLERIHPDDRERSHAIITDAARNCHGYELQHRLIRPDGATRILLAKGEVMVNDEGQPVRMAGAAQDITEMAEMTAALEQQNAALEKMNKELASFSYIASHDLQEPLRKIQTFVGLILENDGAHLSPKGADYFTRIRAASGRMQNLINALLDYSRIEALEPRFERVALAAIIDNARNVIDELAESKRATIEITTPLPTVWGIPLQLTQLFQNLLENALKYSRKDVPPVITISCTALADATGSQPARWCITVADNGIGFEPQYAARIFELFQRLHDNASYEGSGIGLAICKKIADIHHGTISATGTPGQGAAFQIILPNNTLYDPGTTARHFTGG